MVAEFDLTGRVALVTGVGSPTGIGFAAARLLGAMGASLVVSATTDRVHERAAELPNAVGVVGDLTEASTASTLVAAALGHGGQLDIVVHAAGMTSVANPTSESGRLEDMSFDDWRAGLSRNLDAAFHVAHAAVPALRASTAGRLVMVSSITGPVMAMRGESAYGAAKAGVVGLVRSLALEVADDAVTVNAVAPGWIATGSQTPHEHEQGVRTPMRRSGTAAEVASAIGWLCSPLASYTTGQCVIVDGGNSIAEERA